MFSRRQQAFLFSRSLLFSLSVFFLNACFPSGVSSAAETDASAPIATLLDAKERGLTKDGVLKAVSTPTYDSASGKDVLELDYSIPAGAKVVFWARSFPAFLSAAAVSAVRIGAKAASAETAKQISLTLEIKGSAGTQQIPVRLREGWSAFQESLDWAKVGTLEAVEFSVSPAAQGMSAEGSVAFTAEFISMLPPQTPSVKTTVSSPRVAAPPPPKPTPAAAGVSSMTLMSAGKREVEKDGDAKGTLTPSFDEVAGKDVLEFDYSIEDEGSVEMRAKDFPAGIESGAMDTLRMGIRVPEAGQVEQITAEVLLKGTRSEKNFPLELKRGWNSIQEFLDGASLGDLKELRLRITAREGIEKAHGTLYLAFDFVKRASPVPKTSAPDLFTAVFGMLDAGEKGVFNIGPSQGSVTGVFDESLKRDLWEFSYTLPEGSTVGIWTKSYPEDYGAEVADAVKIGVKVPHGDQIQQVTVKAEIKGTRGMQSIPLRLQPGWNYFLEAVNWNTIGNLTEVVYVVSPMAIGPMAINPIGVSPLEISEAVTGKLFFDLRFGRLTPLEKNFTLIKVSLVILLSLLMAGVAAFLKRIFRGRRMSAAPSAVPAEDLSAFPRSWLWHLKKDLFYGAVAVTILAIGFMICGLGKGSTLDTNFHFLGIALLGAALSAVCKRVLAGKTLTPSELFQDILLTGLLAAGSSRQEILQAPATWSQLFLLTNHLAALTFVIYQSVNVLSMANSGKHLRPIAGGLIVLTPYLLGWILLLENAALLQDLAGALTLSVLAAWPVVLGILGRAVIVFAFNEVVISGISLATQGKVLNVRKAHLSMLFVSVAVALAPEIADWGSTAWVGALPALFRGMVSILATILSYAGLWGEVYLITGAIVDGVHRKAPSSETVSQHSYTGMRKGMAYSGILLAILYLLYLALNHSAVSSIMASFPLVVGLMAGALVFPLIKTIIESFDGSLPFFERAHYSYRNPILYVRGAVVGFGLAFMISRGLFQEAMPSRIHFGCMVGLAASLGVSLLRDALYTFKGQGNIQSWRLYLVDAALGAFVGSAVAFYLDSLQVPVVIEKFKLYTSAGFTPVDYITYPLVNKWGRIDLGSYSGGAKLLFTESLAGVINWSIAAWLFAVNKVFMEAFFQKDTAPIKFFFSKAGFMELIQHMLYVLRWGLWMSPIIFTFLRMMPDPTWYNQDGAIRTLVAIWNKLTLSPEAFRDWSLTVFVYVLAFDFFRVLIWMDHMGLRVATLVNLSFIGMDKLDEKTAKFIGPAAAQRCIPEGVKRFTTWAPLLIPFYIPRGAEWDYAWGTSLAIQNAKGAGLVASLRALPVLQLLGVGLGAVLLATLISFCFRAMVRRGESRREKSFEIGHHEYKTVVLEGGEGYSEVVQKSYDVSRRCYDNLEPCGRALFVVDMAEKPGSAARAWPIFGNFPRDRFPASRISKDGNRLKLVNENHGVRATIEIGLVPHNGTAEVWTILLENLSSKPRALKIVPYLEWVLNRPLDDRFHTQYARLYPEMEYVSEANAVLSWQKNTKSMGILASEAAPEGFHTSRMDFIGRARSLWTPRILETMGFLEARDMAPYPTFDPIGCLVVDMALAPAAPKSMRLMIGWAKNKKAALEMIEKHLAPKAAASPAVPGKKRQPLIGHGEILPGTPQPYSEYTAEGRKLIVRTPFTTRPYDHALSNAVHSVMVTNRGLHTSCNGNSQQNRVTPDWPDTVTKEVPAEAIYLYDPDQKEWFSPTYHPLNDLRARYESEFSVDGTAVFRMSSGSVSTQLTVFVPPDEPTGVYLLTVKNDSDRLKRMRIAPYFQIALAFQPERAGALCQKHDKVLDALLFENPRNLFRTGWAFASMSIPADRWVTKRGAFFGRGRGVTHPFLVETGEPDLGHRTDDKPVAGFLGTVEIPARGEKTIAIVLGQTDTHPEAIRIVQKYKNLDTARKSLEETRDWWLRLMNTLEIKTDLPEFDAYQYWLKYQALAERIWARRGFYQTSGAFGFRDQLQDTVNMIWVDPALARKQILLHASHQFVEGDVFHWFFTLTDGRTSFSCRSHASDNLLWLSWGVAEYLRLAGDETILDEMTSYVTSEFPFAPLPKNKHGWGHFYQRSTRADTVYRHCMKSIDVVLEKRMGRNGIPLIGTGDWNDGLDEIGSAGKGESIWLGFFLYYILKEMLGIIEKRDGLARREHYEKKMKALAEALERTWRTDRYLRAIHDDGTEIGIKGSGIWEIDALTAAWAVMAGINPERNEIVFNTALQVLEKPNAILLGWPSLREDTKPYLGRSSKYPEGVRENGMYCHGVQWLVKAARVLAEHYASRGNASKAASYRETALRLWLKISSIPHVTAGEIEIYGGQPNKQAADLLTNYDQGRMIWHGYTGAAGWMLRQAIEGVVGASLAGNQLVLPKDLGEPRGRLKVGRVRRDVSKSPIGAEVSLREGKKA
ncbi:MAG: GH36-type glycosyl hydrolase domain-containing protein [Candidatus Omnitrophota bacterium]